MLHQHSNLTCGDQGDQGRHHVTKLHTINTINSNKNENIEAKRKKESLTVKDHELHRTKSELEAPTNVIWHGNWEPNKKYVKTIKLKNRTLRLLKVKFSSPSTRTFSTPYPSQTLDLAAGSTKEVPITFRPSEAIPYHDQVTFTTQSSKGGESYTFLTCKLLARIPTPRFEFPSLLDFDACPVGDSKTLKFTAQNMTSVEACFEWRTDPESIFSVYPSTGVIPGNKKESFRCQFSPKSASLFRAIASCRFGNVSSSATPAGVGQGLGGSAGTNQRQPSTTSTQQSHNQTTIHQQQQQQQTRKGSQSISDSENPQEYSRSMHLVGLARYPQIFCRTQDEGLSNQVTLEFDAVDRGDIIQRNILLENPSQVPARFVVTSSLSEIDRPRGATTDSGKDSVGGEIGGSNLITEFRCLIKSDEVPGNGSISIPFEYHPILKSSSRVKRTFTVSCATCPDVSHVTITCVGRSPAPTLIMDPETVDFGIINLVNDSASMSEFENNSDLECRHLVDHTRQIKLINKSPDGMRAIYQFVCDGERSAWDFSPIRGVLNPSESVTVTVRFRPSTATPYFRRIPLLIEGGKPKFINLCGSAYCGRQKPAHVSLDNLKCIYSDQTARLDPDKRQAYYDEGQLKITSNCLHFTDEYYEPKLGGLGGTGEYYGDLFEEDISEIPAVSLSESYLAFGRCTPDGTIHSQSLQVTNHTEGCIIAQWYESGESGAFSVHPSCARLKPGASFLFKVRFSIFNGKESLFGGELELNCFYSQMLDYSEVKTRFISPGWCKTVHVSANTFLPNSEPFPSNVKLPKSIILPPQRDGSPTYTTLVMESRGTLPVSYNFKNIPSDADYVTFPPLGIVHAPFQLLALRSLVKANGSDGGLVVELNSDNRYDQHLRVQTLRGKPKIECPDHLYLQPTAINGETKHEFCVYNPCHLPIAFNWYYQSDAINILSNIDPQNRELNSGGSGRAGTSGSQKVLKIYPENGIIGPLQNISFQFTFTPNKAKSFLIKPQLNYKLLTESEADQYSIAVDGGIGAADSGKIGGTCLGLNQPSSSSLSQNCLESRQSETKLIRCIGIGVEGLICAAETLIDFGSIVVSNRQRRKLQILNQSNCTLDLTLSVVETLDGGGVPLPNQSQGKSLGLLKNSSLSIDNQKFVEYSMRLGPRSARTLLLDARCTQVGNYSWEIYYTLGKSEGEVKEKELLCHCIAECCYPLLQLRHVNCSESGEVISKALLYSWCNIKGINQMLRGVPDVVENLSGDVRPGSLYSQNTFDSNIKFVNIDFGSAVINKPSCHLPFELLNPGKTDAKWKFIFPADMRMELDGWAENSELDQDEYEILQVEDNKLFQVKPPRGVLGPNESCIIRLTYSHNIIGAHSLPIVLSIEGGQRVQLMFRGVTLSHSDRYLHFPSREHRLIPIELGFLQPPIQHIEFYNGSYQKIFYEIDLESFSRFQEENWSWPIFKILNPKGSVEPNSVGNVMIQFSPLEAIEYDVMMDIHIVSHARDSMQRIKIVGVGYDPRKLFGNEKKFAESSSPTNGTTITGTTGHTGQTTGTNQTRTTRTTTFTDSIKSKLIGNAMACMQEQNQLCKLSADRVTLGDIPMSAPIRRVVFLENRSTVTSAKFHWRIKDTEGNSESAEIDVQMRQPRVRITPTSGTLDPHTQQMVVITFMASHNINSRSGPGFHAVECVCEVTSMREENSYRGELAAWKREKRRQEEEFTIDDKKCSSNKITLIDNKIDQEGQRESERSFSPYKTLPPISPKIYYQRRKENAVGSVRGGSGAPCHNSQRTGGAAWFLPEPPKPSVLTLTVTARTLTKTEYLEKYPDDYAAHFTNKVGHVSDVDTNPVECLQNVESLSMSCKEARTVRVIMGNIVRTLLEDRDIQKHLTDQYNETPYYFVQLREKEEPNDENKLISTIMDMEDDKNKSKKGNGEIEKSFIESFLAQTIENIMESALKNDTFLTSKPRTIVNPPNNLNK